MNSTRASLVSWTATACYAAAVFVLSVIPMAEPPASVRHADKLTHLIVYALLAWMVWRAMRPQSGASLRRVVWVWAAASSYGGMMEVVQAWLPWRSASWTDLGANAVGAALGVWVGARVQQRPSRSMGQG